MSLLPNRLLHALRASLCFVCALGPVAFVLRCEAGESLESALAAWRHRAERIRSFEVCWTEAETVPRNTLTESPYAKKTSPRGPASDVTHELQYRLVVDGARMRTEWSGKAWMPRTLDFAESQYVAVANGAVSQDFHAKYFDGRSSRHYPIGFINKRLSHQDIGNYHFLPPLLAFRCYDKSLVTTDTSHFSATPEVAQLGDLKYIVFTARSPATPFVTSWWIAPSQDYAVVRVAITRNADPTLQLDIDYKLTSEGFWAPSQWHSRAWLSGAGGLTRDCKATVTRVVLNAHVPDAEFSIAYPAGTKVVNNALDTEYIVTASGGTRTITSQERLREATYEDLLATEPGMAGLVLPWYAQRHIVLITICIALIVIAGALLLRWQRARSAV